MNPLCKGSFSIPPKWRNSVFQLNHLSIFFYKLQDWVSQAGILYIWVFSTFILYFWPFHATYCANCAKNCWKHIGITIAMTDFGLWLSGGKLIMWRETNYGLNYRRSELFLPIPDLRQLHRTRTSTAWGPASEDIVSWWTGHSFKQSAGACFGACSFNGDFMTWRKFWSSWMNCPLLWVTQS